MIIVIESPKVSVDKIHAYYGYKELISDEYIHGRSNFSNMIIKSAVELKLGVKLSDIHLSDDDYAIGVMPIVYNNDNDTYECTVDFIEHREG